MFAWFVQKKKKIKWEAIQEYYFPTAFIAFVVIRVVYMGKVSLAPFAQNKCVRVNGKQVFSEKFSLAKFPLEKFSLAKFPLEKFSLAKFIWHCKRFTLATLSLTNFICIEVHYY